MKILHAFWLPDSTDAFVQDGNFRLWVETAEISNKPSSHSRHPRQLPASELNSLIAELGIAGNPKLTGEVTLPLPSDQQRPLPCPELAPFLETDFPEQWEFRDWQVDCWKLDGQPIASLNELHFQTLFQGQDLLPGGDFLFWYWFGQSLKAVMFKDSFVPALRLKKVAKQKTHELHAGWDFAAEAYENLIREAMQRMPPSAAPGYEAESLLLHCAEVLLQRSISQTNLTQALAKKIDGSLVDAAFNIGTKGSWHKTADLKFYRSWLDWVYKLSGGQRALGFQLAFQLHEAGELELAKWCLEFKVSARHDPSLSVALEDYWEMPGRARQALQKSFGKDFEQNLLLQLGQAARIYPALWEGLETDQPIGLSLSLEDAFGFLNETAWVLEDAGFRIIVPAWWTPQGRRRAKLKMRSSGKTAKTIAGSSKTGLSLDNLLQYQYELTLGDEPVSPDEWEQLVNAKTPLVQFRGQWVALDRDKMREMLAFWKAQGDQGETLDMLELLRRNAEETELFEIDAKDALAEMLAKLRDHRQITPITDPPRLNAILREYQKRGVAWLEFMEQLGLNGCLADDMGLGKTIQVIAHWCRKKNWAERPAANLLIAPTSVIGNWRKEVERFAPHFPPISTTVRNAARTNMPSPKPAAI